MRTETKEYDVPIYNITYGENGDILEQIDTGEIDHITELHIYADEGKMFIDKATGVKAGTHIQIGTNDSINNYEEVAAF